MFGAGEFIGMPHFFDLSFMDNGLPREGFLVFQTVFCATAATIVSGAMAERTKFSMYLVYTIFISVLIYPISGHWTWGGGWLMNGEEGSFMMNLFGTTFHDFAGSTVVTNLAACAGGFFALAISWMKYGKPSLSLTLNGILAGLVGITAGCDAVSPAGAALIGAICGVVMIFSVDFIDKILKIDDPVGASSVHGVCGFLGTVLTGLFSTSEGLFYGHGFGFLCAQLFGALVVGVWAAGMGFIIFKALDKIHGLRVPARIEEEGLDIYEHGESAYN